VRLSPSGAAVIRVSRTKLSQFGNDRMTEQCFLIPNTEQRVRDAAYRAHRPWEP